MVLEPLTTNDVRVLRLLSELGPRTRREIADGLRSGFGSAPALRRVAKLIDREYATQLGGFYLGQKDPPVNITVHGVRALRAADQAAYGRLA